jgi:hypothetical protein
VANAKPVPIRADDHFRGLIKRIVKSSLSLEPEREPSKKRVRAMSTQAVSKIIELINSKDFQKGL